MAAHREPRTRKAKRGGERRALGVKSRSMPPATTTTKYAPFQPPRAHLRLGCLTRLTGQDLRTRRWPRHRPTPTPQTNGQASNRPAQQGSGSRSTDGITSSVAWILASSRRVHMPSPRRARRGPGMAGLPGPVARHDPCADGHWTAPTTPGQQAGTGAEDRQWARGQLGYGIPRAAPSLRRACRCPSSSTTSTSIAAVCGPVSWKCLGWQRGRNPQFADLARLVSSHLSPSSPRDRPCLHCWIPVLCGGHTLQLAHQRRTDKGTFSRRRHTPTGRASLGAFTRNPPGTRVDRGDLRAKYAENLAGRPVKARHMVWAGEPGLMHAIGSGSQIACPRASVPDLVKDRPIC